jgi:hypothetical protein
MITPTEAATKLCPLARLFADSPTSTPGCKGPVCMAWVWETVTTAHPKWKDAVLAKAAETGEKVPHKDAAAWVAANKEALGMVPVLGRCGLGA